MASENLYLKVISKHLDSCPNEVVKENRDKRTIEECWNYIVKLAREEAKDGCAMIEDSVVFGWAEDFYTMSEEDYNKLKAKKAENKKTEDKKTEDAQKTDAPKETPQQKIEEIKPVVKEKNLPSLEGQMNLFDFIG